jgi:peptide/nickel transport system substrate-binding protein
MLVTNMLIVASVLLSACATPTPVEKIVTQVVTQVVKETVKETVIVEGTPEVVEKEVTKVVEKEVTKIIEVEKVVTATPEPTPTPMGPVKGGTVIIVRDQEPDAMVGPASSLSVSLEAANFVLDPLIGLNDKGEFILYLAKEVPSLENGGISEDGLTYTFHLREDVKWHDGEPFTAEDVKFTFDWLRNPDSGLRTYWRDVESVEMPDDYTVVLKRSELDAAFLNSVAGVDMLPEHVLRDVEDFLGEVEYLTKPWPGTGPFQFVEWEVASHT